MNISFSPKALIMAQNKYLSATEQFPLSVSSAEYELGYERTFGKVNRSSTSRHILQIDD